MGHKNLFETFYGDFREFNYGPFGMTLEGRNWEAGSEYRYGFGGWENDDEIKGTGSHLSFGDYGYDPRLAKRWRTDPFALSYSWISPYAAFANNPLYYIDLDGEKIKPANKETRKLLRELKKNGTEEFQSKLKTLRKSDVIYKANFYATNEEIKSNTKGLTTLQKPIGVTTYDFAASEKKGKDVVNVLVTAGDLQGYDKRLVAVNEIVGAHDFEASKVGYAEKEGNTFAFAFDVGDEYDQAMDVIAYAEKNNIALPEKSAYYGLKNVRDNNTYMPTREQKLDAARLVLNNGFGYEFPDTKSKTPSGEVGIAKNKPGDKGTKFVYRENGKTVKGKIE